jgi:hypothetical protein
LSTAFSGHLINLPLYIDDATLARRFGGAIGAALTRIRELNANQALNPDMAVTKIRAHLGALFAPDHQDVLEKLRPASWSSIHLAFVELMFRSDSGRKTELVSLAAALQVIYEHSVSPARQSEMPRHVEVVYFFHMAKLAASKGQDIDLMDLTPTSQMYLFCKYCWRQAARLRNLCSLHTGGSAAAGDPDTKPARYKSGQRRLRSFTDALNSLVTADVLEFHATEFHANVLFRPTELGMWLERRCPLVWRALFHLASVPAQDCCERLLVLMYDGVDWSPPDRDVHEASKRAIRRTSVLAWPMVTRMEAFFRSEKIAVSTRGGRRPGASQKPSLERGPDPG